MRMTCINLGQLHVNIQRDDDRKHFETTVPITFNHHRPSPIEYN